MPKLIFFLIIILQIPFVQAVQVKVAIVIDDLGYRATDYRALALPGNITFSILPHTPFGKKIALQAHAKNKDVFLHIPMEAENGKKLGPGGLTASMGEADIHNRLRDALAETPFALGINNHMGSKLTKLYQPMAWTMGFLKEHQLLFLDSKTCIQSQAEQAAIDLGVPVKNRHVFLDNQLDEAYITQQFEYLISQAKANEVAIAIAHPHPETMLYLTKLIPTLAQRNIALVSLSSLYEQKGFSTEAMTIAE